MDERNDSTVTVQALMERFGVSRSTLWRMIKQAGVETMPAALDGKERAVRAQDLPKLRRLGNRRRT
jgi:predicted DNA-binding transcriptional regulator AlpA